MSRHSKSELLLVARGPSLSVKIFFVQRDSMRTGGLGSGLDADVGLLYPLG